MAEDDPLEQSARRLEVVVRTLGRHKRISAGQGISSIPSSPQRNKTLLPKEKLPNCMLILIGGVEERYRKFERQDL